MLPDRVSNPGLLTYESGALPIALRGPAACLNKVCEELLHYPRRHVSVGKAISKMLKFYIKVFYVMGNALTGGLSCPCDRYCFYLLPSNTFIFHSNMTLTFFPLSV